MISLLVPFRDDGEHRARVWNWLRSYWQTALPDAEIIEGHHNKVPFSKARAVNDAAARATGTVFAILDADAYLPATTIQECADIIERERRWFVPYQHLHRLSEAHTLHLLTTNPSTPIPLPPTTDQLDTGPRNQSDGAHKHGAMCQVMSRQAFETVGGFDPRFNKGWGSEDTSFLRSLDTLWAPHETMPGNIAHLWHARIGENDGGKTRKWQGQRKLGANKNLGRRYRDADGNPRAMRQLIAERQPWRAVTPDHCHRSVTM